MRISQKRGVTTAALTLTMKLSSCLLLSLTLTDRTRAQATDKEVDEYISSQMSKYGIPGLAVAVIKHGKVMKLKGYGLASVEFDIPATENSIFQIYSTTKIFAGVAIMKLVEDGKLSLDTPVTDVVENLPSEWKAIRVRNLLTHTSGLPEMSDNPRFANLPEEKRKGISWEEGITFVAEVPLKFKPGDKFSYHRSGYNLLALIVERLAKKTFAAFLEERVFAPLGMSSTSFGDSEMVIKGRPSTAYNRGTGELRNWVYSFGFGNPGAGLNSSASDLLKFMVALDAGKVLKRESMEALWTPVKLNDGSEKNYGLGWSLDRHKGRKVVGHEGGGAAWVTHFPAEHLSIVVLCNLNGARADEIQYGTADFYLGP